jgi:hypothetical protein
MEYMDFGPRVGMFNIVSDEEDIPMSFFSFLGFPAISPISGRFQAQ